MSVETIPGTSPALRPRFQPPLVLSLALRELRGGLSGFYVFVACIALGVAVITAVGALGDALRSSFERQGETLLGGDATLARPHQRAGADERAWLESQGRVSETATVRAMARRPDGAEQVLVEVKGFDAAYPLVGRTVLGGGADLAVLAASPGLVAAEPIVLERLGLKVGDKIQLGTATVTLAALIEQEPDRISERISVGPRLLVPLATLTASGLADPGSLVSWRYALKLKDLPAGATKGLDTFRERVKAALPEGGFSIRDRRDPSPQVTKTLERLRQFLTLLGLTSLLIGGVGVANAVATYIDRRRRVIAAFKSLGASRTQIFGVHFAQVMMMAALGIGIGLAIGLAIPFLLSWLVGDALPIKADVTISVASLAIAAAYGLLVALLFTVWPLGRAEMVRAGVLFRDEVAPERVLPRPIIMAITAAAAALLVALAVAGAEAHTMAFYYCLAIGGVLAIFFALGAGITWVAARLRRPRIPEIALAIGNIAGPGGLARSVVLSLGTGLSLLVAVALVDRSIVHELTSRLPANSPSYFVLDLKRAELADFETLLHREFPTAHVNAAPMLRGRIIKLGDRPVEKVKARPEHAWVLSGDRGLSYADSVPEGSRVVEGQWWAPGYAGEPLVSFEREIAQGLGLTLGDTVTVNVLGRNVTARIANLRDVKWESLAINFVMVFSPNTLVSAPHNLLATVTLPADAPIGAEARLAQSIGRAFPAATAIRVKDAIAQFNLIFERIMTAVRAAGAVTLIAGALVLAGALATAQRRRIKQAVILKALGATRARILATHLVEYGLLALVTGVIAALIGGIAAYVTVWRVIDVEFVLSWAAIAEALGVALGLVVIFGGLGTWRVLQERPAQLLRNE